MGEDVRHSLGEAALAHVAAPHGGEYRLGHVRDASSRSAARQAQSVGLLSSPGPLIVGLLRDCTGSWSVPLMRLLMVAGLLIVAGYVAGRPGTSQPA